MKARLFLLAPISLCLFAQAIQVGEGAPDRTTYEQFVNAYFRGIFSSVVEPPTSSVSPFGTGGYVQEFRGNQQVGGGRFALVKPFRATTGVEGILDVYQVWAPVFAYYSTVNPNTAGFPTMDTATCPSISGISCYWQAFDKSHALFAFSAPIAGGSSTFLTKETFYTEWQNNGGIQTFGPATSAEQNVTSPAGSTATVQSFQNGIILSITSGILSGRLLSVRNPVFAVYAANGGPSGFLGLPSGPEQTVGTKRRQTFEGGAIEYEPGQTPTVRLPVASVSISSTSATLRLNLNDTFTLEATPYAANGEALLDRTISWVTSNGRAVSIQPNGRTAVIRAVGGGVATITAVSEGRISSGVAVSVTAPCCQIGEGAPTAAAAQAFNDAITRNRLSIKLPNPAPVRRVAAGYQQELQTTAGTRVVAALSDRSAQAWIMTGAILAAFEQAGGAGSTLGYPTTDPTPGGRQSFEGGALAGSPIQLVTGGILVRWALLNFETGALGPPTAPAAVFSTFAASAGIHQSFRDGAIFQWTAGAHSGRAFVVAARMLAKYQSLGSATGRLGAPVNEEFTLNGRRRQDFEGGYLEYVPGSDVVEAVESARKPTVTVLPATAVAGSRLRLAAGGFPEAAVLRISATGQPDFVVRTANGSYSWDIWIPSDSPARTVTVRAVDTLVPTNVAEATYTVRSAAESRPQLTKVSGDTQSGAPGTRLPLPLRVNVKDESGNPLVGVTVLFTASPGAQVFPQTALTDSNGDAESTLRLPSGTGIALATAEALYEVVTFSALVSGSSISTFPRVSFNGDPYVASAAAILKYFQDRGELNSAAGVVTPAALDSYLRAFCTLDSQANRICDGYLTNPEVPNLWRLVNFAGGALQVLPIPADQLAIRETLASGSPVLVSLRLANGHPTAVVAIGVNADGSIQIMDPSPSQPRSTLNAYLSQNATIAGAIRFVPRPPASGGFLLTAYATTAAVSSPAGACGVPFGIPGAEATTIFIYCDGSQSLYQAGITSSGAFRGALTDLAADGPRFPLTGTQSGWYQVTRPALTWQIGALEAVFGANSVRNAATFAPFLAPGAAISIFGTGLSGPQSATTVEIGGLPATVLFATPFQVNAVIPLTLPPGPSVLRLSGPFGTSQNEVQIQPTAPAIFQIGENQAAVTNQDGVVNTPSNPAARGEAVVMYGTGFGAVNGAGRTEAPVTVRVGGVDVSVVYAGLTPGSIGLYQVNIQVPGDLPPGLFLPVEIRQGGVAADVFTVAIR